MLSVFWEGQKALNLHVDSLNSRTTIRNYLDETFRFPDLGTLEIQATGNEKVEIEDQLVNLPGTKSRLVIYRGEMAQFILDNLYL